MWCLLCVYPANSTNQVPVLVIGCKINANFHCICSSFVSLPKARAVKQLWSWDTAPRLKPPPVRDPAFEAMWTVVDLRTWDSLESKSANAIQQVSTMLKLATVWYSSENSMMVFGVIRWFSMQADLHKQMQAVWRWRPLWDRFLLEVSLLWSHRASKLAESHRPPFLIAKTCKNWCQKRRPDFPPVNKMQTWRFLWH